MPANFKTVMGALDSVIENESSDSAEKHFFLQLLNECKSYLRRRRICSCFHQESTYCPSCRGNWSWGLDKNELANEKIKHSVLDKFALQRILKRGKHR